MQHCSRFCLTGFLARSPTKSLILSRTETGTVENCVDSLHNNFNPDSGVLLMTTLIQTNRPTLQRGDSGSFVSELQSLLLARLGSVASTVDGVVVDGDFGAKTEAAVKRYQQRFSLTNDGIVGANTWASLLQTVFSDLKGHWAANFIVQLANAGLVKGMGDGSFRPDAAITRAEYAALLVKGFDTTPKRSGIAFPDVPSNFWANTVIQQAYRAGFLSGYPDGTFKPNQTILRQDVLVSLVRGMGLPTDTADLAVLNTYADKANIQSYAQKEVAVMTKRTIVVNYPSLAQLNPTQGATRAEVVAMLGRAWALQGPGPRYAVESPYVVVV